MNFRLATKDDLRALVEIDSVIPSEPERKQEIISWIGRGECYVAERNEKILAYAVLNYNFFHRGFIEMLMVSEKNRKQGIGKDFFGYLFTLCHTDTLWVSTNESNRPMQKLLARMGFKQSGHIDNLDKDDPELIFYTNISKAK